jgi:hypothetical protein
MDGCMGMDDLGERSCGLLSCVCTGRRTRGGGGVGVRFTKPRAKGRPGLQINRQFSSLACCNCYLLGRFIWAAPRLCAVCCTCRLAAPGEIDTSGSRYRHGLLGARHIIRMSRRAPQERPSAMAPGRSPFATQPEHNTQPKSPPDAKVLHM